MYLLFMLLPILGSLKTKSYPRALTPEEEQNLLFEFKHGSKDARDLLIEHNLRLVAHIVKKYSNTTEDKDDLLSIGTMGLIKAVDSYKFDSATKLSTYASRCIENEILMRLRSNKKRQNDSWLFSPVGYDKEGNEVQLIDVIKDESTPYEETIILSEDISKLSKALKVLDEREIDIINKRYGLDGRTPLTQKEIASSMDISRSYVSRIEKRALIKLYFEFNDQNKKEG